MLASWRPSQPYEFGWNQHCFTDGQDFECSDQGDIVIPETITLHYQAIVGWFLFHSPSRGALGADRLDRLLSQARSRLLLRR